MTKRLCRFAVWLSILVSAVIPVCGAATPHKVPGDRWMEIDLYWFQQQHLQASVDEFWDRFAPLYQDIEGDKGIILNVGWTVEYIMDWPGADRATDLIVLPKGNGQRVWVRERGTLNGDWKQMQAEWKERFSQPIHVNQHGYDAWTYNDLRKLIIALKVTGEKRGISGFKVGSLIYGWTDAYGETAPWVHRHPEAFFMTKDNDPKATSAVPNAFQPGRPMSILNTAALLKEDPRHLGAFPAGIPSGTPFHEAFAGQWGSLSKAVGLDAIMLRDSIGMPVPYYRGGPYGRVAPDPLLAKRWNDSVSALVRETKQSNPKALVMMYSNGASAMSDWRGNCFDLESIAKEGFLDVFVDQTWAGAWNEAGVRKKAFWNFPIQGWTYQLAYTLMHAATLANTHVRHYPLVETFDAWEDWDVLHTAPDRLRWGIWAYSHAGVKTPAGLKLPEGSYISWAHQGKNLLSGDDVAFLRDNINAAVMDAHNTTQIFGPTLVYSRESTKWQMDHATPDNEMKEWIDEQAGSVMKWPVPILSATRLEWLPRVKSDLFILQTPVHLSAPHTEAVLKMIASGQPVMIFGSPANGIDQRIERAAGLVGLGRAEILPSTHEGTTGASAHDIASGIPAGFTTETRLSANKAEPRTDVLYSVQGSPALTLRKSKTEDVAVWDPPTFTNVEHTPMLARLGGSAAPYALTAGVITSLLASKSSLRADGIDVAQTMNISAWRTADGKLHLLAANLEEGMRDDADRSREVKIDLPPLWNASQFNDVWSEKHYPSQNRKLSLKLGHTDSVLLSPVN